MSRIPIWLFLLSVGGAAGVGAQTSATTDPSYDSRVRLEAQATQAETANRMTEALLLRARLKSGDFQEGDRIVVVLETTPAATDTMQVRAGKVLQFPQMSEVSLDGVLRSELTEKLRQHLSKYLTNPNVRATPLLPLAVLGSVHNPGFIYAPADYLLRDLLMRAGGPTPDADVSETVVRRAGKTIWQVKDVRAAFSDGLSLDRLHLHAGDEVYVPQQSNRFQLSTILSIVTAGAAIAAISISH